MDGFTESGPFNKPDPSTKGALWAEDRDTINKLKGDLYRAERNNKYLALAVVAGVLVGGFGIWKSDTKYYMVERTPDHREVIYIADAKGIPANETIRYELADFVWNSRTVSTDNRVNLEIRKNALAQVQMSNSERDVLFDEAKDQLEKLYENFSIMVTDIIPTNRGGEHWSLEWNETVRDRRTGRIQSKKQFADVMAIYVDQDGENPGGIMFSKPIESIHSE